MPNATTKKNHHLVVSSCKISFWFSLYQCRKLHSPKMIRLPYHATLYALLISPIPTKKKEKNKGNTWVRMKEIKGLKKMKGWWQDSSKYSRETKILHFHKIICILYVCCKLETLKGKSVKIVKNRRKNSENERYKYSGEIYNFLEENE